VKMQGGALRVEWDFFVSAKFSLRPLCLPIAGRLKIPLSYTEEIAETESLTCYHHFPVANRHLETLSIPRTQSTAKPWSHENAIECFRFLHFE